MIGCNGVNGDIANVSCVYDDGLGIAGRKMC